MKLPPQLLPLSSKVDWCEENYQTLSFIAEFWNTTRNSFNNGSTDQDRSVPDQDRSHWAVDLWARDSGSNRHIADIKKVTLSS